MNELQRKAVGVLHPLKKWSKRCHEASIALVTSGQFPGSRVARGFCKGVGGQHSWVVLGDPYDRDVTIVDPTLWSYSGGGVKGVYVGKRGQHEHTPHGWGSIFGWGRPQEPTGTIVTLKPRVPWSSEAKAFLALLGPLDEQGWQTLAHAPVGDWPACEVLTALYHTKGLGAFISVDIIGMATDVPCSLFPRSPT